MTQDIDVMPFISPIHVKQLELIATADEPNLYEKWKGELISIVESVNRQYPDKAPLIFRPCS